MILNNEQNKTVTELELLDFAKKYCLKKLAENKHKPNPLAYSFNRLEERTIEEEQEVIEAFKCWHDNPSEATKEALILELADRLNFIIFFMGKVSGFRELIR